MGSKTTICDIARALGVTAPTVSRALNDHPAISTATKKAVRHIAHKLHYRKNKIASSLRLGRSQILGVIIPSAEINFFGSVIHGIEKVATQNDYSILIYQSNEEEDCEKKGAETFLRARVDGILASIAKETTHYGHYLEIKKRGVPLVFFDRANDDLGVSSVVIDDYMGAFKATQHLIDQGCRNIAHIAGQQHIKIFRERMRGYKEALRANRLRVRRNLIAYGTVTIASGKQCMEDLLPAAPDAVFAVEDFTALGALQCLKEKNKLVPDDVAIIGFANEAFGSYITPSLSTVDQQTRRMGEEAAKLFFRLWDAKDTGKQQPSKIVLEPTIIYRDSSLKHKP